MLWTILVVLLCLAVVWLLLERHTLKRERDGLMATLAGTAGALLGVAEKLEEHGLIPEGVARAKLIVKGCVAELERIGPEGMNTLVRHPGL